MAAVALAERLPAGGRALVAAPPAVLGQWRDELARFAPALAVRVVRDVAGLRRAFRSGVCVVAGYDTAARWLATARTRFDLVVDEATVLTGGSQRARGLWAAGVAATAAATVGASGHRVAA
jgi:hypothetical protein